MACILRKILKVSCAGSDPTLLGAQLLRRRKGKISMDLEGGTVCGLNISVYSLYIICMAVIVIENKI